MERFKGFVLSLDAMVAAALLLTLTVFIAGLSLSFYSPGLEYERLYYTSKDVITVSSEVEINEMREFPSISYYISQGVITQDDMDKTLMEVIGALWVSDNQTLQEYARNITEDVINRLVPERFGYAILMDGYNIYNRSSLEEGKTVSRFNMLISGFELGKPVSGYVARAWATKIKKNTTEIFPFFIEGAGNDGGDLEVWKKFNLSATAITNATLYISVHYGWSSSEFEALSVNGVDVRSRITWLHESFGFSGRAAFGVADVTDVVHSGNNTLYMRIRNDVYNSHVHPGMRLEVEYQSEEVKNATNVERQRVYFDRIVSKEYGNRRSGAWALVPFYIPKGAVVRNVVAHIRAEDIENIAGRDDVRIYFNDTLYTSFDAPPDGIVDVTYNFTDMASEGTNWVLVQLNYRIATSWWGQYDDFSGIGDTIIYSEPLTDPDNSSYIEFEYELPEGRLYYGYVDVTMSDNFGGSPENPKSFNLVLEGHSMEKSFMHVAQLFSNSVNVSVLPEGGSEQTVFSTTVARAIPSSIYIDPTYYNLSGNNVIEAEDICSGCYILPESSVEYSLWIPSSVGYGKVNETEQGAVDDAVNRLNETLGKYAVATNIETEVNSVSGVPSMWGPANLEVRVWS